MYRLRVKEVIEKLKVTQSWLARNTKVNESMIRRMVRDPHYMPSAATLAQVAKALHVPMEELLEELPDPPPPFLARERIESDS
jgi:transcriptional regulator with XRE-family HTH domain